MLESENEKCDAKISTDDEPKSYSQKAELWIFSRKVLAVNLNTELANHIFSWLNVPLPLN